MNAGKIDRKIWISAYSREFILADSDKGQGYGKVRQLRGSRVWFYSEDRNRCQVVCL